MTQWGTVYWADQGKDYQWILSYFYPSIELFDISLDTAFPIVNAFSVEPTSVTLGNAFTASYSVSDTGGSGLNRVELWRKSETVDWQEIKRTSLVGVGNGPYSGSFSDAPSSIGTYWYGIHVVDNAENWASEDSPIEVEVIELNNPPQLSNGYVDPSSGTPSTDFYYYVTYFDPDGDNPSAKQVIIDGTAYIMSEYLYEDSRIIYRYGPINLSAGGTHYYFFYFEDGRGDTVRLPSGTYLGPTVSESNNPPNTPSNPSPANHASGISIDADLSWSGGDPDAGDTVTYDVYFGTSTSSPLVSDDQSAASYDLGTLNYNIKYYWKIITTDNHGASTEGPLWDFTTVHTATPVHNADTGEDFQSIQAAIDDPDTLSGHTIIVEDGTYTENIDVNKDHLTIQSENGAEATTIQAANSDDHVFEVTADYVNIRGFSVKGASGYMKGGVYLCDANYCDISNNNVLNNYYGIEVYHSSSNSVKNNIVNSNRWSGIDLNCSRSNILRNNAMSEDGISINGYLVEHWNTHIIDVTNTVNDKPVYYKKNVTGGEVPVEAGQVILANCIDVVIEGQNISNTTIGIELGFSSNNSIINNSCHLNVIDGIYLRYSNNNTITSNTCNSNQWFGIRLDNSSYNSIFNNTCKLNTYGVYLDESSSDNSISNNACNSNDCGICLRSSSNNTICNNTCDSNDIGVWLRHLTHPSNSNLLYLNNFINNHNNAYSEDSTNIWSSPEEITYKYGGNTYTNYLGNYWSDYTGSDTDGDGIGDTPYVIDSDKDNYPLVEPFENYVIGPVSTSLHTRLLAVLGSRFGSIVELEDRVLEGNRVHIGSAAFGPDVNPELEWIQAALTTYGISFSPVILPTPEWLDALQWAAVDALLVREHPSAPLQEAISSGEVQLLPWSIQAVDAVTRAYPETTMLAQLPPNTYEGQTESILGYAPTDTTPPTVSSVSPEDGATGVVVDTVATATFSEPMDETTINGTSFTLEGSVVSGTVTYDSDTYTATFTPDANLEYDHEYTAALNTDITDLAGNPLAEPYTWSFITEPEPKPIIHNITPSHGLPGEQIKLVGENFGHENTAGCKVRFGVSLADIISWTDTEIIVEAPSDYGLGIGPAKYAFKLITLGMSAATDAVFDFGLKLLGAFIPDLALVILELDENDPLPLQWLKIATVIGVPAGAVDIRPAGELDMPVTVENPIGESNISVFTFDCADIDPIDIEDSLMANLASPGELRVRDLEGRVTGLIGGIIKEEILGSSYLNGTILIMNPTNAYVYEVIGTNTGVYGLNVALLQNTEVSALVASGILTSPGASHMYTIDWDTLAQGKAGVTVQVDSDGDGIFEKTITADNELTGDEFILQTATTIDFDPDTLNLASKGKFVTVYIELPPGYDVGDIDISSIMLNGGVQALAKPTQVGDYDNDGIPDLMVKFDRADVQKLLKVGREVKILVTGELTDGTPFGGTDVIRVIDKGKK